MLKTIIIDDELESQVALSKLLQTCCSNVELVAIFGSIKDAILYLNSNSVSLVFLDIELPNENGFALLEYIPNPKFKVIFTTAYNQYAVKAFKYSALGYLLKPYGCLELQEAISKVQRQEDLHNIEKDYHQLINSSKIFDNRKIAITHQNGFDLVEFIDILWFEAEVNYTIIHLKSGAKFSSSKTLKLFEDYLDSKQFIRISRSAIVNLNYVIKFNKKSSLTVTLIDKTVINVSESRKDILLNYFDKI